MNVFLKRFQVDAPMVPFLIDTLDEQIRYMCSKFILNDVLKKAKTTTSLIKLNLFDSEFWIKKSFKGFERRKKSLRISSTFIFVRKEVKQFLATLCNHLLTKNPINSHFPVYVAEYSETCKKLF